MIRLFFCAISRGNGWAVRELPLRAETSKLKSPGCKKIKPKSMKFPPTGGNF